MGRLEGKTALVTGGGNGIGRACALALGEAGAAVCVNDLGTDAAGHGTSSEAADAVVAEITSAGGKAVADYNSVADQDGVLAAIERARDAFGRIDISVACAGSGDPGSIFEQTDDEFWFQHQIQLGQKWWLAKALVPQMAEQGFGRLINICSHGATGMLGQPAFASAMGGVVGMTAAIATETAALPITANCIAPGGATRQWAKVRDDYESWHKQGVITDADWQAYLDVPPPEYVGPVAAWLATDAADKVTGQVVSSAGGKVGVWDITADARETSKGDHREVSPWTLAELDDVIPGLLAR